MNRRGFVSLLAGSAGAVLVPWRANSTPRIFLPPRSKVDIYLYLTSKNAWLLNAPTASLTEKALEELLETIKLSHAPPYRIERPWVIVSPEIKCLIDTDPVINRAAYMALNGEYLP